MTEPPPVPPIAPTPLAYQPVEAQAARDAEHLRYLAIGHYVYGGLTMLCSSVFIVHVVIGILTIQNPAFLTPPAPPSRTGLAAPRPGPPPQVLGWLFAGVGSVAVLLGWTVGVCTIVSGRCVARRRARLFSLIMAGVNCMSAPLGTTLGVFTFIVLLRESVRATYDGRLRPPAWSPAAAPFRQRL